jgi:transposase
MKKDKHQMRNSKYTREYRDSTVQLVINSEQSVLQIARDLDVNPKTIYNWVREYKRANNIKVSSRSDAVVLSAKSTLKETIEDENKRLRAENKVLKQERDILRVS